MACAGFRGEHGTAADHRHGVAAPANQDGADAAGLGRQGREPGDGVAAAPGAPVRRPWWLKQRHCPVRGTQLQPAVELLLGQAAVACRETLHPARQTVTGDERHAGFGACHGAGLHCEGVGAGGN